MRAIILLLALLLPHAGCLDSQQPPLRDIPSGPLSIPPAVLKFAGIDSTPDRNGIDLQHNQPFWIKCKEYKTTDGPISVVLIAAPPSSIPFYGLSGCDYTSVQFGTQGSNEPTDVHIQGFKFKSFAMSRYDNTTGDEEDVVVYSSYHDGSGWIFPVNVRQTFHDSSAPQLLKLFVIASASADTTTHLEFLESLSQTLHNQL